MGPVLTKREAKLVELMLEGLQHKEIAARVNLATRTVKWHCANIYPKFGVATRGELLEMLRRKEDAGEPFHRLAPLEKEICLLAARDLPVAEICAQLKIGAPRYLYLLRISYRVLGVKGRRGLAVYLMKRGMLPGETPGA